jgi:glutamate decarboxylase
MTAEQVMSVIPNIVISSVYQAAWEKYFRYFDVAPRFIKPTLANKMRMKTDDALPDLCDEKTIGVVGILGNHYNGAYDPVWEINEVIQKINEEKGYQIGIHVDAASGGFTAPFQKNMPAFDFRLKNVLSISASGHKFGESSCGTGWLVFRRRDDLAEHIAVSVTYLGGKSDSITLNFSRPATACFVQFYKFLRLGKSGYQKKVDQQMGVAKFIRDSLKAMKYNDKTCFEIVDAGDERCLPVVAARLNPKLHFKFNSIDLQHALSEHHWYVSGYSLGFEDFSKGAGTLAPLCSDESDDSTMFRVVVKSNLTMNLAIDLVNCISKVMHYLEKTQGTSVYRSFKAVAQAVIAQNIIERGHAAC